ncbi:uncharacterized protein si:dkeyp-97a10.3 [Sardina pilchardus]|uniref:uncharacterized protein si:dkeyp-97a10.3 n=1 Tax=Sardina pilchardus TaxID=27697 RepID=UPI002E130103
MTPTSAAVTVFLIAWLKCGYSQDPVEINFATAPVLATSGAPAEFSIITLSAIFTTQWLAPGGGAIGTWTSAGPVVNGDYTGRVSLTATRLEIITAELRDAGNYTVVVTPSDTTGLIQNSRSVELKVFVAVAGVSLSVDPSVAVEGRNVTIRCTFSAGTQTTVSWGRGGTALTSGDRITISGGTLVINPARRDDTGDYSCTVSNPVSARTTTISLTVYYGPDTPTLTKEAEECVGGGDAVVGQALEITCASESLPPATFSWQHDGQAVSSSQSSTGSLALQISSSDSSGQYVCTAQNSITGGSSQQETDVSVVATCLNGGEVAGIVIACFIVIVIIIVIIIVLLRQRNMDRRLRDAISLQKTDPVARPPPANVRAETAPDPPLHNMPQLSYRQPNGTTDRPHNGLNNNNTNNGIQQNGHLSNGTPHRMGNTTTNGNPIDISNGYSGHQNNNLFPNSGQQNPNILIQTGQMPAGTSQPTVHVNLNTLPRTDQQSANTLPQTVNVNLNAYPPPSPGRQEIVALSAQQANTLPQNNVSSVARFHQNSHQNSHQDGLIQTGHSHVNPAFEPDVAEARQPPPYGYAAQRSARSDPHVHNDFAQARQSRPTDVTHTGHRSTSRQPSTDRSLRHSDHAQSRSRTRDGDPRDSPGPVEPSARHRQRPWDTLRGTPAYPSQQARPSVSSTSSSADSQSSGQQPRPFPPAPSSGRPAQTSRPGERGGRAPGREAQRANDRREDHSPSFMDPNAQRQRAPQVLSGSQPHASQQHSRPSQSHNTTTHAGQMANAAARSATAQVLNVPQTSAAQPQNHQPPPQVSQVRSHALVQSRPEQRQTAPQGPGTQVPVRTGPSQPAPLTQATLQHHTRHANPFANRNEQTQAALLNAGPQARQQPRTQAAQPAQRPAANHNTTQAAQPAQRPAANQSTNNAAHRPPTPPPVLQPLQFQALPKERKQQQHARAGGVPPAGAVPVGHRHPVHMPPGHRPPGATQRPVWHEPTHAHRHPRDAHLHANLQGHAPAHRPPPAHERQVHRSRPR